MIAYYTIFASIPGLTVHNAAGETLGAVHDEWIIGQGVSQLDNQMFVYEQPMGQLFRCVKFKRSANSTWWWLGAYRPYEQRTKRPHTVYGVGVWIRPGRFNGDALRKLLNVILDGYEQETKNTPLERIALPNILKAIAPQIRSAEDEFNQGYEEYDGASKESKLTGKGIAQFISSSTVEKKGVPSIFEEACSISDIGNLFFTEDQKIIRKILDSSVKNSGGIICVNELFSDIVNDDSREEDVWQNNKNNRNTKSIDEVKYEIVESISKILRQGDEYNKRGLDNFGKKLEINISESEKEIGRYVSRSRSFIIMAILVSFILQSAVIILGAGSDLLSFKTTSEETAADASLAQLDSAQEGASADCMIEQGIIDEFQALLEPAFAGKKISAEEGAKAQTLFQDDISRVLRCNIAVPGNDPAQ